MNLLDRPRRLRANPAMREMTAENHVEARHLITPHFVVEGKGIKEEIGSMPGVYHVSVDNLVKEVGADLKLGLKSHLMFGIPSDKDPHGNSALAPGNVCESGVQALKKEFGDDVITEALHHRCNDRCTRALQIPSDLVSIDDRRPSLSEQL